MKKLLFLLAFGLSTAVFSQEIVVTGTVLDAENQNEALAFASVHVKELNMMVNADLEGNFELALAPGNYTFVYDFVGYDPIEQKTVLTNEGLVLNPVVLKAYEIQSPPTLAMNE
ncbi:MAG: carboxypeptidase-like regulatory domain-containing protein [Lutimonas sp.]